MTRITKGLSCPKSMYYLPYHMPRRAREQGNKAMEKEGKIKKQK